MPSGKVINADETLYNPKVVTEKPDEFFHDYPG